MFKDQEIRSVKAPDYETPQTKRPSSYVRYGRARLHTPSRSTMQSGRKNHGPWRLEFEPKTPDAPDYLMGWIGSTDVLKQVHIDFPSKEAAIAFCEKEGIPYDLEAPPPSKPRRRRTYAENFVYDRVEGTGGVATGQYEVTDQPPGKPPAKGPGPLG